MPSSPMRAELKAILKRSVSRDGSRRQAITELLADEYPELYAVGLTTIQAIQERLEQTSMLEAHLDTMTNEQVGSLLRRSRMEFGSGKYPRESYVFSRLKRILGENIRLNIMSHHAKDWKGTLRQSIAHLKAIEIVEAAEVGSGGMGEWSKERTNWKIQIVSIARGVREAPYHNPLIRHLRTQQGSLSKHGGRSCHSRESKWNKKKLEMERRRAKGFQSPLSREILPDEGMDGLEMESSSTCEADPTRSSVEEEVTDLGVISKSWGTEEKSATFEVQVTIRVVEVGSGSELSLEDSLKAQAFSGKGFHSVSWSWGEHWV